MRKIIYLFVALILAVIGKDMILHYNICQSINTYIAKNSPDIKADQVVLKLWPLGGAHIQLVGATLDKDSIKVQAQDVSIRNPLLSFTLLSVKADQIVVNTVMTIQTFQGVVNQTQEEHEHILSLKQGLVTQARLDLDRIKFAADQLIVQGQFIPAIKQVHLEGEIPALRINDLQGTSLTTLIDLKITNPVDGRIELRMKGIDDLLQALVEARLVKPKELPLLQLGARLFANANEEIPLTIKFKDNQIFLGPVKLQ